MGVTGLWALVDGVGHPVNLETLQNKVLAIDLSIWVNQSIKGIRDKEGRVLDNAHVLGLFHRICKLLFYRIKPIFVFDGNCPQLKRHTIAKRQEQRVKAIDRSRQGSVKILKHYIASQLCTSVEQLESINSLPALKSSLLDVPKNKSMQIYEELIDLQRNQGIEEMTDKSDSDSDVEPNIAHNYTDIQNIDSLDLDSENFKSLPPEIRYEILTELRQKYKGYRNTEPLPQESNDFSDYQMKRLLRKRSLQHEIEQTIQQLNSQNADSVLQDWGQKEFQNNGTANAGRLMSDANTHFILMKKCQTFESENPELKDNKDVNDYTIISENHSMPSIDKDLIEDLVSKNPLNYDNNKDLMAKIPQLKADSPVVQSINENDVKINSTHNTIEISDESDIEQQISDAIEGKTCLDNKIIDIENVLNEKPEESFNNFTKLKPIEISSDSSDDDFEEVLTKSPDSIHELMDDINKKWIENIVLNKKTTQTIISPDRSIGRFKPEVENPQNDNEMKTESLQTNSFGTNSCAEQFENGLKVIASSSKCCPTQKISREEILETRREVNKQNRYANYTTDKMMTDCQELLKLFGIPFITSPTEAEAQCATLEEIGLTNGSITDDSDILLFGAQTVYKNFFTSSKYVELYKASDIESRYGLSRSAMICIAMLCGSDYTDGVDGVGAVKATEILSEFSGEGLEPLIKFKNWWLQKNCSNDKRPENKIRAKLLKLQLSEAFPNQIIFDAYMKPTVDKSKEPMTWGMPQLDDLRRYAFDKFGWSAVKADQVLLPVMKKVNEKQTQMRIDSYFKIQTLTKDTTTLSKRLNTAIDKLRGVESGPQTSGMKNGLSAKLKTKVKNQRKKRNNNNKVENHVKKRVKKLNIIQEINLSESSESD